MSNVTLDILGRRYTVACAPGEESHIAMLGSSISDKLAQLPNMAGQSEPRTLLFAALLLADELHEAQKKAATPAPPPSPPAPLPGADVATPLENLADRLEWLASRLEGSLATS